MKFTQLILIASMLLDPCPAKSPTINYTGENVSLQEVFAEIKAQSDVYFFYDADLMKESKNITIDVKDLSLEQALDQLFMDLPLTWAREDRTITIIKR